MTCASLCSLSRRRPDALAWKAACVTTTIRSGSCCISSTLWYSSSRKRRRRRRRTCCRRAHHGNTETILYEDFTQRRRVYRTRATSSSGAAPAVSLQNLVVHFPVFYRFFFLFSDNVFFFCLFVFLLLLVYFHKVRGRCFPLDRPLCVNRLVFLKLFPLYSNIPVHWCDSAIKTSLFFKYASLLKVFPQLLLDNDTYWPKYDRLSIEYEMLPSHSWPNSCTHALTPSGMDSSLLCKYWTAVIISPICRCYMPWICRWIWCFCSTVGMFQGMIYFTYFLQNSDTFRRWYCTQ